MAKFLVDSGACLDELWQTVAEDRNVEGSAWTPVFAAAIPRFFMFFSRLSVLRSEPTQLGLTQEPSPVWCWICEPRRS